MFCKKCGTNQNEPTQINPQQNFQQQVYQGQPVKKKKGKGCLISLGIVAAVFIIIAVVAINSNNSTPSNTDTSASTSASTSTQTNTSTQVDNSVPTEYKSALKKAQIIVI